MPDATRGSAYHDYLENFAEQVPLLTPLYVPVVAIPSGVFTTESAMLTTFQVLDEC